MTTATMPNGSKTQAQAVKPVPLESKTVVFKPFLAEDEITLSIGMVMNTLATKTRQGHRPTEDDCIRFIMLCKARGLNPFEGDAYLIGYDTNDGPKFNLVTAIQAFVKRAEVHPLFDGMESGVIVARKDGTVEDRQGDFFFDDERLLGGWARVYVKGRSIPTLRRIKLECYRKPFGVWKENPATMICKCAEADALRSTFPNKVGGMYLEEEVMPGNIITSEQVGASLPTKRVGFQKAPAIENKTTMPATFSVQPEHVPADNGHFEAEMPTQNADTEQPSTATAGAATEATMLAIEDFMIENKIPQTKLDEFVRESGAKRFRAMTEAQACGVMGKLEAFVNAPD